MAKERLNSNNGAETKTSRVEISPVALLATFAVSAFVAFTFGLGLDATKYHLHTISGSSTSETSDNSFPNPLLIKGKDLPFSSYTSRHWKSESSASRASLYLKTEEEDEGDEEPKHTCDESYDGATQCNMKGSEAEVNADGTLVAETVAQDGGDDDDDDEDDEDEHLPAGQHLFIDIEHVDEEFLNSEVRLAEAMVATASQSELTLLSYHCHSLVPSGVSCVGVLLESHVSFHTWPSDGVITIDLFTCGSGKLVPVLPIVTKLFGVPRSITNKKGGDLESIKQPHVLWAHKLRGFRPLDQKHFLFNDLGDSFYDLNDMNEMVRFFQS